MYSCFCLVVDGVYYYCQIHGCAKGLGKSKAGGMNPSRGKDPEAVDGEILSETFFDILCNSARLLDIPTASILSI